jgi:leucyl-tRNA synthetase
MKQYDHAKIESKWQDAWAKARIYETKDAVSDKDNFYLLVEFPYPSGNLHVGHWYSFAVPDILARKLRMEGKNVLYPIGFDAFGLPAENAAIKNKVNPRDWTESNMDYMRKQLHSMGTSFDWSREVVTCHPDYYKWTQWLFLQLYKSNLVYRKETMVNWCPNDKTVLANEQVVDGKCERCGHEVVQKEMLQWNIKITDYADRLVDDLEKLDWPEPIRESQRNWIGRSEGAEIDFPLDMGIDDSRFVLLHGKGGSPDTNFFPWLKGELEKKGYEVQAPQMPGGEEPDDNEQAEFVLANCKLDEKTVIIGHSFGGVVALMLLERGVRVR